jgi:nitrate reductase NapD
MAETRFHCISSAVVIVKQDRIDAIGNEIARFAGCEVVAAENARLVIVMEGASAGELGGMLASINDLDGVVAANMVFEHIEEEGCPMS